MSRPPFSERAARRALADALLAGGASYREAARTARCSADRLRRAFPGKGLSKSEGGQLARALVDARRAGVRL